jgi:hypothetical protein
MQTSSTSSMRIAVLSLLLAACGSVTTYQSADTLPRGTWQAMVATGVGSFSDEPQETKVPTFTAELAVRRGIGEDTDVGFKLYTAGIEASIRHRIKRGVWSWALLGSIGGMITNAESPVGEGGLTQLRVGSVATKRRSTNWAWNMGPTVALSLLRLSGGGTATGALFGGFFGFDWRFGNHWHLVPEVSLHVTAAGDVPVDGAVFLLGSAIARDF